MPNVVPFHIYVISNQKIPSSFTSKSFKRHKTERLHFKRKLAEPGAKTIFNPQSEKVKIDGTIVSTLCRSFITNKRFK